MSKLENSNQLSQSQGVIFVDASNLLFGAKNCYGQEAKADYKKILSKIKEKFPETTFTQHAFFPAFNKEVREGNKFVGFINALTKMGWKVHQLEDEGSGVVSEAIIEYTYNLWDEREAFVFVTGSGDMLELYEQLEEASKGVSVFAFPGCLAADISMNEYITTHLFGEEVLWHYQSQPKY